MRISIAMATFNGARFIAEQLDSFAAQTRLPDELVISDDSSNDDTVSIAEAFATTAPFPVRIFRNDTNLGFNRNFARALSHCSGQLLLISDQDDIWYPEKILEIERCLTDRPDTLTLIHDEHLADGNGNILTETFLGNVRKVGYPDRYYVVGNCTALRRDVLELLLPFPDEVNYDVWIALLTDLLRVRYVLEKPLQLYRRHGNNATEPELAHSKPTVWKLAIAYGRKDARVGWAKQQALLMNAHHRISEWNHLIDVITEPGRADAALARINCEVGQLRERAQVASLPRWRRWRTVLSLWASGFYGSFAGWKSAAKDLVRP